MKFNQLNILSILKIQGILSCLDEVLGEAKKIFLNNLEWQESLKRQKVVKTREFLLANYPSPLEDQATCDKF